MKKILLSLAVLVILLLLVMPYVTGRVAQSVTQELTAQLNYNNAEYGTLSIEDYQRGYRTTQSTLLWEAPLGLEPLFTEPVRYQCEGKHGVATFRYDCRALNVSGYTEFINENLSGKDPLTIGGSVSVLGQATQYIKLDAFTLSSDEAESMYVKPGIIEIDTDQTLESFVLRGEFEGLTMTSEEGLMEVMPASIGGEISLNQHKMALGETTMTVQGMKFESQADGLLEVGEMKLGSYSREEGENLSAGYRMTIEDYRQQGGSDSSDPSVVHNAEDIEFGFDMSGVNIEQLALVIERVKDISTSASAQGLDANQESDRNAQYLAMLPELEKLLKAGLGAQAQFSASYQNQPLTARIDLGLLRDLKLGDFILISVQPAAFFSKIKAEINNTVPASLVGTNPQFSAMLGASRWYQKNEDSYQSQIKIEGEEIALNGQKYSVEEFLALLMSGAAR